MKRWRKKSPSVISFMRYSGRAKNSPNRISASEAPKGSEIVPPRFSSRKVAGMPNTVSAPNQVANTMAITTIIGRERPAVM